MNMEMGQFQKLNLVQQFEQSPVQTMMQYGGVELLYNLSSADSGTDYEEFYKRHRQRLIDAPNEVHVRVAFSLSGGGKKNTLLPETWMLMHDSYLKSELRKTNAVVENVYIPFAHVALAAQVLNIVPKAESLINPHTGKPFKPGHYPYNLYVEQNVNGYDLIANFMHFFVQEALAYDPIGEDGRTKIRRVIIEPSAPTILYGIDQNNQPIYGRHDRGVRAVMNLLYKQGLSRNLFIHALAIDPEVQRKAMEQRAKYQELDSKQLRRVMKDTGVDIRTEVPTGKLRKLTVSSDRTHLSKDEAKLIATQLRFDNAPPHTIRVSNDDFIEQMRQLATRGYLQINDPDQFNTHQIGVDDQIAYYRMMQKSFQLKGLANDNFEIFPNPLYLGDLPLFTGMEEELNLVVNRYPQINVYRRSGL